VAAMRAWIAWASGWVAWAWGWIGANYQPLAVVLAALGVAVTWWYVRLTRRLATAANTAANAALQQAAASLVGAKAAAEQARITRQMFEASHRPVLELTLHGFDYFNTADSYRLDFDVKNHGQVPAILTESRLVVRQDAVVIVDRVAQGRGMCIFPSEEPEDLRFGEEGKDGAGQSPRSTVEVELTVSYHGFDDEVRTSRLAVVGNFDGWRRMLTEIR